MAAKKKNEDDFDQMRQRAAFLKKALEDESAEARTSSKIFRKLVISWLMMLTDMVVTIVQHLRAKSAEEKEMNEEAVLGEAMEYFEKAATPVRLIEEGQGKKRSVAPGGNGEVAREEELTGQPA